jgi:acyl-CoA thioesterase-1
MHRSDIFLTRKDLAGGCLGARNTPGLLILFLFVLLVVVSCSNESSTPKNASGSQRSDEGDGGTIVAVGDSLTAGYGVDETEAYPALLEKRLLSDGYSFKVINAGVSGETSSGTRSRIEWVIRSLNPDIVILETGANDGLRGVDPTVLQKNLDEIVTTIQANGIAILLAGMKMPPNLGPVYTARFAEVFPTIAAKYRIPLIPFFLESVAGDARYNLPDRLHPNPEGYRRILDDIYPYVLETIKRK